MKAQDAAGVAAILKESPEAAQWASWKLHHALPSEVQVLVAEEGGRVVGMAAWRAVSGEAELLNLAVHPEKRNQGWGRKLVEACLDEWKTEGVGSVFLEVRESNSVARHFYAALGFAAIGRRPRYYRDPAEDALILSLSLKQV